MNFLQILILGLVQGAAELLPVSSSAHVIVAEKLMGLDPSSPEMTFLLVMLHTGTMFAVIVYFWSSWLDHYCSDAAHLESSVKTIGTATVVTVIVGLILQWIIVKVFLHGQPKAEIEQLFSQLPLIGGALAAAGVLILFSGTLEERRPGSSSLDVVSASIIGAVQGLCLPFRGFSRSGGTISAGLLLGVKRRQIEEFSFALAVVLTPLVVGKELWRLIKAHPEMTHGPALIKLLTPGLLGMICSFVAGYLALKLLSSLLEAGRWKYFGYYCLAAAAVVFGLAHAEAAAPDASALAPAPVEAVAPATSVPDATTNAAPSAPATNTDSPPMAPASAPVDQSTAPAPADAATNSAPATNEVVAPRAQAVDPADLTNSTPTPAAPAPASPANP
jgi:undecaprenyl-diphosphatase